MYECNICLETLNTDIAATLCGHVFHSKCISAATQVKGQCPTCRARVCSQEVITLYLSATSEDYSKNNAKKLRADGTISEIQSKESALKRCAFLIEQCRWQKEQFDLAIRDIADYKKEREEFLEREKIMAEEVHVLHGKLGEMSRKVVGLQSEVSRQLAKSCQAKINNAVANYLEADNVDAVEEELQNPKETIIALKKACNFRRDQYRKLVTQKRKLETGVNDLEQQQSLKRASKLWKKFANVKKQKQCAAASEQDSKKATIGMQELLPYECKRRVNLKAFTDVTFATNSVHEPWQNVMPRKSYTFVKRTELGILD